MGRVFQPSDLSALRNAECNVPCRHFSAGQKKAEKEKAAIPPAADNSGKSAGEVSGFPRKYSLIFTRSFCAGTITVLTFLFSIFSDSPPVVNSGDPRRNRCKDLHKPQRLLNTSPLSAPNDPRFCETKKIWLSRKKTCLFGRFFFI